MAEKLVEKCGITYEEAGEVLKEADYDLLEAMIILERRGRLGNGVNKYSTGIMQNNYTSTRYESAADAESLGEFIKIAWRKLCEFCRDLLKYQVVISKNGREMINFPLILAIILVCCTAGVVFAAVVIFADERMQLLDTQKVKSDGVCFMPKILIVEDEPQLARFVQLELEHEEYETVISGDGREGLTLAEGGGFDLILLDIMLPGLNGLEVLRRLRKAEDHTPVIMLTARDSVMDKVSGLDMGADDYITKPFAIEELLARIRVTLRQHKPAEKEKYEGGNLTFGELSMDTARHTVTCGGKLLELTVKEFGLLQALLENVSIVLTREQLLERVWGYDYFGETNVVDVYIRYLRSKLEEVSDVKYIQTVRGVGYVIK